MFLFTKKNSFDSNYHYFIKYTVLIILYLSFFYYSSSNKSFKWDEFDSWISNLLYFMSKNACLIWRFSKVVVCQTVSTSASNCLYWINITCFYHLIRLFLMCYLFSLISSSIWSCFFCNKFNISDILLSVSNLTKLNSESLSLILVDF